MISWKKYIDHLLWGDSSLRKNLKKMHGVIFYRKTLKKVMCVKSTIVSWYNSSRYYYCALNVYDSTLNEQSRNKKRSTKKKEKGGLRGYRLNYFLFFCWFMRNNSFCSSRLNVNSHRKGTYVQNCSFCCSLQSRSLLKYFDNYEGN